MYFLTIQGEETNIKIVPWVLVLRGIVIISIFIYRYLSYEEADLDKKIKEEKKLSFEINENKRKIRGKKSSNWIHKILLKDLKVNYKNYIVFIISEVLTVAYVYGFLGNLFIIHNMQQTNITQIGEGITYVVLNALVVITIITILIQIYALKNYVQNRMYDLKTLMILGMKKKEIYINMVFLLIISLLVSYFIGAILGNGMIFIFRKVYGIYLQTTSVPKANIILVTILSFIVCLIILVFILTIVQDIAIESRVLNISASYVEEKMVKPKRRIFILPIFLIILIIFYSNPHWAESKYIIYPWIMIFVIFTYYASGYVLGKVKNKNKYSINNILTLNLIFYKSRSYLKNSLLLYILLFVMFSTYIFQIATLFPLSTKELYPYDYICLGYERDKAEFEKIEKNFDIKSDIYPVSRITVPGGEDGGYGSLFKTLPIGHHLGISESTYKALSGKNINLNDREIYILYQEDKSNKAHPLDFYITRSKPLIRIGQPQLYNPGIRHSFFTSNYDVIGEKREILLGRLTNAMYENIVVFSDEYFDSEYKKSDGIKYLMTINSNMKNDKNLESYLDNYKKTHNEERQIDGNVQSVYKGKDLNEAFQGEKILKLIINTSILITSVIASIIIVFVHIFGNISHYKNRYEVLSYLGEKKNNSNYIIKKEVSLFAMTPFILAILTSLLFIAITLNMRGFSYLEMITSTKVYISITLAFLFIYSISTFIISYFLIKEIGGK